MNVHVYAHTHTHIYIHIHIHIHISTCKCSCTQQIASQELVILSTSQPKGLVKTIQKTASS